MIRQEFTTEEARRIGDSLSVDWEKYNLEQFRLGLFVELEHGMKDPATDVTHDDLQATGKIAIAHLNDLPDYYTRLYQMFANAEQEKIEAE
jgi:hypothetical protein